MYKFICKNCGKENEAAYDGRKYCNAKCCGEHQVGRNNPNWRGGIHIQDGYVRLSIGNGKRIREHTLIAEQVLGHPLGKRIQVHHINGNKSDNRNCNLLICVVGYHTWLHQRMSDLYMKEKFNK